MDFNKLTIKSQEAVQEALNLVRHNGQQSVETAHLLLGILKVGDSIVNFLENCSQSRCGCIPIS